MVYLLGDQMVEASEEDVLRNKQPAVFVVSEAECPELLKKMGIHFSGTLNLNSIYYNKLETHRDYLFATLHIPEREDILGKKHRMYVFINKDFLVLVGNSKYTEEIVPGLLADDLVQGENKVRFLYNFGIEVMRGDAIHLEEYEKKIMKLEDTVGDMTLQELHSKLHPMRRELQTLRSYYEQMSDVCDELEEDKNSFFDADYTKYFRVLSGRFERLRGRCSDLLEYAKEVKDAYQAECDGRQNNNMAFLTVVSTIFLPLTLITGWYGMNFQNMPELQSGYPVVIILSLVVIMICIYIFKKKKMF
ncbi:MAG: cobalt transporter [Clostridia bacterium]|jgi:magnesium transporter|nr:CorA family divalent cation transporter [Lachnospiraceae bacterium]NCC00459.1 cobalt transporter [Clostridia bacterium]NCD02470.1 cobalt transporter [Clostridia bacterium]